jgi:hypothetical protein
MFMDLADGNSNKKADRAVAIVMRESNNGSFSNH